MSNRKFFVNFYSCSAGTGAVFRYFLKFLVFLYTKFYISRQTHSKFYISRQTHFSPGFSLCRLLRHNGMM